MLDIKAALDACLDELLMEYDIEKVDSIPGLGNLSKTCIWKIQIPALDRERLKMWKPIFYLQKISHFLCHLCLY